MMSSYTLLAFYPSHPLPEDLRFFRVSDRLLVDNPFMMFLICTPTRRRDQMAARALSFFDPPFLVILSVEIKGYS